MILADFLQKEIEELTQASADAFADNNFEKVTECSHKLDILAKLVRDVDSGYAG